MKNIYHKTNRSLAICTDNILYYSPWGCQRLFTNTYVQIIVLLTFLARSRSAWAVSSPTRILHPRSALSSRIYPVESRNPVEPWLPISAKKGQFRENLSGARGKKRGTSRRAMEVNEPGEESVSSSLAQVPCCATYYRRSHVGAQRPIIVFPPGRPAGKRAWEWFYLEWITGRIVTVMAGFDVVAVTASHYVNYTRRRYCRDSLISRRARPREIRRLFSLYPPRHSRMGITVRLRWRLQIDFHDENYAPLHRTVEV